MSFPSPTTPVMSTKRPSSSVSFEKRFFSDATNQVFCKTFIENALRDPVSGEIGKSIVFAVSQNHAARLTQTLNEMADVMFPGKYQSDFAVQVTSQVPDAQQFTINFANNNLMGFWQPPLLLPDQQGAGLRDCRHDDYRLRLHRHSESRPFPPYLLSHRLRTDQGPRDATA